MKTLKHYQSITMNLLLLGVITILFAQCNNDEISTAPNIAITNKDSVQTITDSLTLAAPDTLINNISYLALGDSYTIGQSVYQKDSWPFLLKDAFQENNIRVDSLKVIARTGWRTDDLQKAIDQYPIAQLKSSFSFVSLLIGVNNQFQGRSFETFKTDYKALLEQAIEIAGTTERVIVLSIPDYGVTPFGNGDKQISQEINQYNQAKKEITTALGVRFYDITSISRKAENDLTLLAPDQLHPSGKMYQEWVGSIIENVLKQLEDKSKP